MSIRKKGTIAVFCGYFLPNLGGIEKYVDNISKTLVGRGYDVIIFTSKHRSDLAPKEIVNGVTIYRVPIFSIFRSRYPIPKPNRDYRQLVKEVKELGVDLFILNTRFHLTSVIGGRIARDTGANAILIDHGTSHFTVGIKILDFIGKIYEHILTAYIKRLVKGGFYGVSKACGEWLRHFNIKPEGVLYNAIDPLDYEHAAGSAGDAESDNVITISYAGRLIKEKGVLNLISAYDMYRDDRYDTRLLVAGSGPLLDLLKQKYSNRDDVTILGRLSHEEMKGLYLKTDIFVHPSLYPEGLPTSILEAAVNKNAIIATPMGGTEEVIEDGRSGIIVDGSVDSIYSSIYDLSTNKSKRVSLGDEACKTVIGGFTWDKTVDDIVAILKGGQKR